MKLKFYNPDHLDRNLKATIHKTGKLGFTVQAAEKMGLGEGKSVAIGRNEEDENDENLYLMVNQHRGEDSFPVYKAGAYFYLNTKALFDSFKWDYLSNTISFEIQIENYDGHQIFKLIKKERKKKTT